jgi:hypothetical protein
MTLMRALWCAGIFCGPLSDVRKEGFLSIFQSSRKCAGHAVSSPYLESYYCTPTRGFGETDGAWSQPMKSKSSQPEARTAASTQRATHELTKRHEDSIDGSSLLRRNVSRTLCFFAVAH